MPTVDIDLSLTKQQSEIFDYVGPARFHTIKKGRRFGFTYGAAIKCIEWCIDGEGPILWGDTVHGNLTRYVETVLPSEVARHPPPLEAAGQAANDLWAEH